MASNITEKLEELRQNKRAVVALAEGSDSHASFIRRVALASQCLLDEVTAEIRRGWPTYHHLNLADFMLAVSSEKQWTVALDTLLACLLVNNTIQNAYLGSMATPHGEAAFEAKTETGRITRT